MIIFLVGETGEHEYHGDFTSVEVSPAEGGGYDVQGWTEDDAAPAADLWAPTVTIINDAGIVIATYEDCTDDTCTCGGEKCKE